MEAAYETLQDAAGLTQLSTHSGGLVFASGDLPRAAETLANMRHCLSAVGEVELYVKPKLNSYLVPESDSSNSIAARKSLFTLDLCTIAFPEDSRTLVPKLLIETMAGLGARFVGFMGIEDLSCPHYEKTNENFKNPDGNFYFLSQIINPKALCKFLPYRYGQLERAILSSEIAQ
ncbi:hypothetical protein NC651_009771 [Populus alba x Populus x berolinensis]|nr:hypothetical protein NC651_009771 [Populus alba x Populus x berolinensis]